MSTELTLSRRPGAGGRHWRRLSTLLLAVVMAVGGQAWPAEAQSRGRAGRVDAPGAAESRGGRQLSRGAARVAARQVAPKLDRDLERRATRGGRSRVIIRLKPGADIGASARGLGGRLGRRLNLISGQVVELPNAALRALSRHPAVESIHVDRPVSKFLNRTTEVVGAGIVQRQHGYTGRGVGVAVIDSGVAGWHDDLTGAHGAGYPYGDQRVRHFVDFVGGQTEPYDDNGHGTHVAGAIAGNGYDANGWRSGIAPQADLTVLKVLDQTGGGYMSDVIAAFDYVVAMKDALNIRVVNLSVGAPISESYWTDPLTLAAKRAVDAGIVVVAAAGNLGQGPDGPRYGSITAPANAPWVIAVGASNHEGTINRADDTIAPFSSRGPTYIDWLAKPDIVAPGVGLVSLSSPGSYYYKTRANKLLDGSVATADKPYLSLSGTSMASPVVAGSIALMLEANPALTPNLVKAILQYTAESKAEFDALTQGAGFLNTLGAVRLAQYFRDASPGAPYPVEPTWSRHIFWGNYRVGGGVLIPGASAWDDNIVWGADWDNIVWGMTCGEACDNIVWGNDWDNIVWGNSEDDNIVWGQDDNIVWGMDFDNIVWGNSLDDNIVWGQDDNIVWGFDVDNIVWGMDCGGDSCDNIVWGQSQLDNIVWGLDVDNIVWGNSFDEGDNIVWGLDFDDNIVWGLDDNIVWGLDDNIVWGFGAGTVGMWNPAEEVDPRTVTEDMVFGALWTVDAAVGLVEVTTDTTTTDDRTTETTVETTTETTVESTTEPTTETTDPAATETFTDDRTTETTAETSTEAPVETTTETTFESPTETTFESTTETTFESTTESTTESTDTTTTGTATGTTHDETDAPASETTVTTGGGL